MAAGRRFQKPFRIKRRKFRVCFTMDTPCKNSAHIYYPKECFPSKKPHVIVKPTGFSFGTPRIRTKTVLIQSNNYNMYYYLFICIYYYKTRPALLTHFHGCLISTRKYNIFPIVLEIRNYIDGGKNLIFIDTTRVRNIPKR